MMELLRALTEFWPLVMAVLALIGWGFSVENRIGRCVTVEQLGEVRESLARIEGALGVKLNKGE